MVKDNRISTFLAGLLSNAAWEWIKNLWGPAMLTAFYALWGKLRHSSPDWWGIGGLFCVSVILFHLSRKRQTHEAESGPRDDPYREVDRINGRNARWHLEHPNPQEATSIMQQNVLINLGRSVDGLFHPLQIEAFKLAKRLQEFIESLGPAPELDESYENGTEESIAAELTEFYKLSNAWENRLGAGYQLRFFDDTRKIILQFRESGVEVSELNRLISVGLPTEKFVLIPQYLRQLAIKERGAE